MLSTSVRLLSVTGVVNGDERFGVEAGLSAHSSTHALACRRATGWGNGNESKLKSVATCGGLDVIIAAMHTHRLFPSPAPKTQTQNENPDNIGLSAASCVSSPLPGTCAPQTC